MDSLNHAGNKTNVNQAMNNKVTKAEKIQGVLALGGMLGLFTLLSPAAAGSFALIGAMTAGRILCRPEAAEEANSTS